MKPSLFSLNNIDQLYARVLAAKGPCIDTRQLQAGQFFLALKGEQTDGHRFVRKAIEAGAAFAIVDNLEGLEDLVDRCELVPDVLLALQSLARHHRDRLSARVLGLTGSNGKTTTKELLGAVLSKRFHTYITPGNLNNQIGMPMSLLQVEEDVEFVILEMGDNKTGDIAELCEIARPDDALITNIGQDHLEGYAGMAGNAATKCELFDFVNQNKGLIFRNANDHWLQSFPAANVLDWGKKDTAVWHEILNNEPGNLTIRLHTPNGAIDMKSQLTGAYNAENIVAAAAVALQYGTPLEQIVEGIEHYIPSNHRSQLIEIHGRKIVADHYNANPSSLQAALASLVNQSGNTIGLVIGEMKELGAESERLHRELAPYIMALQPRMVIGVGAGMLPLLDALTLDNVHYYIDAETAAEDASGLLSDCNLILLKGSRSVQLEKVLEALK